MTAPRPRSDAAFLAGAAALGLLDILLPRGIVVLPLLIVPIVASAMRAKARLCAAVAAISLSLALVSAFIHTYEADDRGQMLLTLATATAVAMWLADRERAARAQLAAVHGRYRLLAEYATDVVLLSNADTDLNWVSPSSLATLGWPPDALMGHRASEFIHPEDVSMVARIVADSEQTRGPVRMRYRWRRPDGSYRWVEEMGRPTEDDGSGQPGRVVQLRDIEAQVAAERELHRRAQIDELTGLLKRNPALDQLAEMGRRARDPGEETALLFIDLDSFKDVNDTWGHAAGDAVLRSVSERARGVLRATDSMARMGGDEFIVWLEHLHGMDEALAVAEKLRRVLGEPLRFGEIDIVSTVSIGVTLCRADDDVDAVIARADHAMYQAKQAGRDRVLTADR